MDFTAPNYMKLIPAESLHIMECDTNRMRNVNITDIYSFMPISKVRLWQHQFSRYLFFSYNFMSRNSLPNFMNIRQTV